MARTQLTTTGIRDIQRNDLNTTTTGEAVVAKLIAGTNITFSSTGVDAGTGDVTINATGGGGITGSGAATQVTYWSGVSTIAGSDSFVYNGGVARLSGALAVASSSFSPSAPIHVRDTTISTSTALFGNLSIQSAYDGNGIVGNNTYFDGTVTRRYKDGEVAYMQFIGGRILFVASADGVAATAGSVVTPQARIDVATTGEVTIFSLDTDLAPPTQTGTIRMVTTDSNGLLSFQAIPSGGGGGSNWTITGSDLYRNSKVTVNSTTAPLVGLDVYGQARIAAAGGMVGPAGDPSYALSVQNNAIATWIELLNNGGTGKGAFFGMTGNQFQQWNFQGGPITFFTNPSESVGTLRMTIAASGAVAINDLGGTGTRMVVASPAGVLSTQAIPGGGGGITGTGTAGQVTYWDGASSVTGSANMTFNGTTLNVAGSTTARSIAVNNFGIASPDTVTGVVAQNLYFNGGWKYVGNGYGSAHIHLGDTLYTATAPNNAAGPGAPATISLVGEVLNSGQMRFSKYGVGTFTGTAARTLQVDSGGYIIEGPVGGGGTPAGTTGQVQFNNAGAFGADTAFHWDNTNKRLGIGTAAPAASFHITSAVDGSSGMFVDNTSSASGAISRVLIRNNAGESVQFAIDGTGSLTNSRAYVSAGKNLVMGVDHAIPNGGTSKFQVYTGGYNNAANPGFTIDGNGNVGIGTVSPATTLHINNHTPLLPTIVTGNMLIQSMNDGMGVFSNNMHYASATPTRYKAGPAGYLYFSDGSIVLGNAPTGAAGSAIDIFTSWKLLIEQSGNTRISSLDTDLTAPTQTGTIRMVTTDSNGLLSHQAIPGGGTGSPGGSNGYVQFNDGGLFGGDPALFWDNTNKRLGIGIPGPIDPLHIYKDQNAPTTLRITNHTDGAQAQANIALETNAGLATFFKVTSAYGGYKNISVNDFGLYNTSGNISFMNDNPTGNINFATGTATSAVVTINNTTLSVAPSSSAQSIKVNNFGIQSFSNDYTFLGRNLVYNGTDWKYITNGYGVIQYYALGGLGTYMAPENVSGPGATGTVNFVHNIANDGEITFAKYGLNTFAGTPTYALGVDIGGNVVEFPVGGGSPQGLQDVINTNNVLVSDNTILQTSGTLQWDFIGGLSSVSWGGSDGDSLTFDAYLDNSDGGYGEIYADNYSAALYARDGINNINRRIELDQTEILFQSNRYRLTLDASYTSGAGYVWTDVAGDGVMTLAAPTGGGGGGVTTVGTIGATPNAAGASISGSTLTLQPANASFGGVVTTAAQTFAGVKTFSSPPTFTAGANLGTTASLIGATVPGLYTGTDASGFTIASFDTGLGKFIYGGGNLSFTLASSGVGAFTTGTTSPYFQVPGGSFVGNAGFVGMSKTGGNTIAGYSPGTAEYTYGDDLLTINPGTGLVRFPRIKVDTLDTDLTAPAQTGTIKMVTTDNAGILSFGNIEGNLLNVRFLTSGTTYTPTAGTTRAVLHLIGGGGGGGGTAGVASGSGAGAGGGAGAYVIKQITGVTGTYTYAIGGAGNAGAATSGTGGTGGNTTFINPVGPVTYTANGGVGGVGSAGVTTATFTVPVLGGNGGTATNGDVNIAGEGGGVGMHFLAATSVSGAGGSSNLGSGGKQLISTASTAGVAGSGYGGGGGGGVSSGNTNAAGGAGATGAIVIYEYR